MSIKQLKQLYYNLIYPHISYSILSWGNAAKTLISKVQVKQNKAIRAMFFAVNKGPNTDSALQIMNLLDILNVSSIYKLQALKFAYLWHKNQLPSLFTNYFEYAKSIHSYNTRYAAKQNFKKPISRTNVGLQTLSNSITGLWSEIPSDYKNLSNFAFPKKLKELLLKEQHH